MDHQPRPASLKDFVAASRTWIVSPDAPGDPAVSAFVEWEARLRAQDAWERMNGDADAPNLMNAATCLAKHRMALAEAQTLEGLRCKVLAVVHLAAEKRPDAPLLDLDSYDFTNLGPSAESLLRSILAAIDEMMGNCDQDEPVGAQKVVLASHVSQ